MRIQNNVTAMNTHRMYTMNNDAVAASAKKLSSGYRINSAADDAAGLAISEKMRSQIRGLNMATKNSQDAISLVQTAEGALQETQNMLQRMNELAVQAATGTNEDLDRTALSKEFEQLKREINDVAEQTNFNNMKILDGSLSYDGYKRSAATAGVNLTVSSDIAASSSSVYSPAKVTEVAKAVDKETTSQLDAFKLKFSNNGIADGAAGDYKLQLKINGQVVDLKKADGSDQAAKPIADQSSKADGKDVAAAFAGLKFKYEGVEYTLTASGTADEYLTAKATAKAGADPIDFTAMDVEATVYEWTKDVPTTKIPDNNNVAVTSKKVVENTNPGTVAQNRITFDPTRMSYGDTFKIGDTTYQLVDPTQTKRDGTTVIDPSDPNPDVEQKQASTNAAALKNGNIAVHWNGRTDDASDLMTNIKAAIDAEGTGYSATIAGAGADSKTEIIVQAAAADAAKGETNTGNAQNIKFQYNRGGKATPTPAENTGSTLTTAEFDIAKMKNGDTFNFTVGDKDVSVTYNGQSRADFMHTVVKEAFEGIDGAEVKGNAVVIRDQNVKVSLDEMWKDQEYAGQTNAIRIQVGALENEQLAVSIDSMNTAGLNLDNSFLTVHGQSTDQNIDSAGAAITATRAAINKVSDQRATLGAMQNRLDHKIANLKIASENLTASESRIRDVDMAQEMTNFTKNNILSQAATAMLAQANSLPQNVLSLLG